MQRFSLLLLLLLLSACSTRPIDTSDQQGFRVDGVDDPAFTLLHDGRLRSYFLHLPTGYDGSEPLPLVLVLHSAMGNGALIAERTGFNKLADEQGFIAVYPNGSDTDDGALRMLTWNAGHCCYHARDLKVDDVGFIGALLDRLQADYPIDPNRIHLTGFSNGAMLAYRLASVLSNRIASIAAVSGNIGGREYDSAPLIEIPKPSHPVSVLAIHGLLDEQVPYAGGRGQKTIGLRSDTSVADSIIFWRQANQCLSSAESRQLVEGAVSHDAYRCPATGTDVELYTLNHGGHAWPGGEHVSGWSMEKLVIRVLLDAPSTDLDASRTIWHFFQNHPRAASRTARVN